MPDISLDFSTMVIFILLTLAIYAVIIAVFVGARRKYKGGMIGRVLQFVIASLCIFLLADVALILIPRFGYQMGYTFHVILKICAMTCLAIGGLKLFEK